MGRPENSFVFQRKITNATVIQAVKIYADTEEEAREYEADYPYEWDETLVELEEDSQVGPSILIFSEVFV